MSQAEVDSGRVAGSKLADGAVEAIRLTRIARSSAVKAHTRAIIALKATLVIATDQRRSVIEPLSDYMLTTVCAAVRGDGNPADPDAAMCHVLGSLARRWLDLQGDQDLEQAPQGSHRRSGPPGRRGLRDRPRHRRRAPRAAGDNCDRIRSEAAFAKLCGVSPVPTGSGKTGGRH